MSNILRAIDNIINSSRSKLEESVDGTNRINATGEPLEDFIKSAFANVIDEDDTQIKADSIKSTFSYKGNKKNPPDIIIRGGDAIEVKKRIALGGKIALNSSFPRQRLNINDPKLTDECRKCEEWDEKDLIYAIGVVPKGERITHLCFIYGDCYASNMDTYGRRFDAVKKALKDIPGMRSTKELGRINNIDPLDATNLRVRAMFEIKVPNKIIDNLYVDDKEGAFQLACVMRKEKFYSFPTNDIDKLRSNPYVKSNAIEITDPDDVNKMIRCMRIRAIVK